MGKLNNYEQALKQVQLKLRDLRLYNRHLIDGFDTNNPGKVLQCTLNNIDVPMGKTLNLLEPQKARDYVKWTTEDHIQGCLTLIEKTFEAEKKRKAEKTTKPKKGKSIRLSWPPGEYTPEF